MWTDHRTLNTPLTLTHSEVFHTIKVPHTLPLGGNVINVLFFWATWPLTLLLSLFAQNLSTVSCFFIFSVSCCSALFWWWWISLCNVDLDGLTLQMAAPPPSVKVLHYNSLYSRVIIKSLTRRLAVCPQWVVIDRFLVDVITEMQPAGRKHGVSSRAELQSWDDEELLAVNCTHRRKDGCKMFNILRGSHDFTKNRRTLWIQSIWLEWCKTSLWL